MNLKMKVLAERVLQCMRLSVDEDGRNLKQADRNTKET